jgi:hypothetical protein
LAEAKRFRRSLTQFGGLEKSGKNDAQAEKYPMRPLFFRVWNPPELGGRFQNSKRNLCANAK